MITAGRTIAEKPTDSKGQVLVAGLATFTPITVGIDQTSLSDLMLAPKKAIQVVVPRLGVPAEVEIGLVGAGDVEGAIVKNGGVGFEGWTLSWSIRAAMSLRPREPIMTAISCSSGRRTAPIRCG